MTARASGPRPELARLRAAAGLSQRQLASILGLKSARPVLGWESGEYAPRVEQVPRLARALGVPVAVLLEAVVGAEADADLTSSQVSRIPDPGVLEAIAYHARELERLARSLQGDGDPVA